MPYNHKIPDAPIAPSMLPRVTAANLTLQDILVLTQPGNNPGEKNKGLELGALFEAMRSSLPTDTLLVDEQDENPSRYLIFKFKGNSAASYLDEGDVGFRVVSIRGARFIVGVIENKAVTTDKLADDAVTSPKIATGAVNYRCLGDNSVRTEKLMNSSVSREKIANRAVSADKLDSTELFTATGWIASIDDSNFAKYLPTSMTLNAKTSTSVAKTAGFSFSNGGFTCYADVGKFNTLSLGDRSISLPLIQNGFVTLSFSTAGSQDILSVSISPGQILEMFVRHRCTWTGGNGVSEAYTYLIDEDSHGDRIHWNFSGINGLYQSQSLIVQNTTDTNKTFYLRVNFDLAETSSVEDSVDYRYVIRSL